MRTSRNARSRVVRRRISQHTSTSPGVRSNHSPQAHSSSSVPRNWRDRLPNPAAYYAKVVSGLGTANAEGWAQGKCLFHEDTNASLSVHVGHERGGWRCFSGCGGGDMVSFEMKRTGRSFKEAVINLIRGIV